MFVTIKVALMSPWACQEDYDWICKPLTLPDTLCQTKGFERALHKLITCKNVLEVLARH